MADETGRCANLRQALELAGSHFVNLVEIGILKTFIDHKVFDRIPDEGDISLKELAQSGAQEEEGLLERFSNYLVAAEILSSPAPGRVAHTPRSRAYKTGAIPAGFIVHVFNFLLRPVAQWPAYFEASGLAAPRRADNIPLGLATGHPDSDLYGILEREPALAKQFHAAMAGSGKIYSLNGVYDFGWMENALLVGGGRRARTAIVDVGGGTGVALRSVLSDNSFVPASSCAVLDLENVVEPAKAAQAADVSGAPRLIGGSMLDHYPQDVRGSLVYIFRRVLNDFPDEDVLKALKRARAACAPDSRVLIIEELLHPDRSKFSIAEDIFVMNFGGKRRSVSMFEDIARETGFSVSTVLEDKASDFGVIELLPGKQ